ncbi:hypothetical protein MRX96_036912 [Rhipicephalus microplus]|uniref:Uncharacterized protein n=1 Tax=Rhipicephalus microplus TaxID=6941 RepID=A0A6G5AGN0_RHIMP
MLPLVKSVALFLFSAFVLLASLWCRSEGQMMMMPGMGFMPGMMGGMMGGMMPPFMGGPMARLRMMRFMG